jgi:Phosphotransferase enzyme family
VFTAPGAAAAYLEERLAPPARLLGGRADLPPLARMAGLLEPLNLAVAAFPVDGELPALVRLTDGPAMLELLRGLLPDSALRGRAVDACRVELGHYGRQHRCVLRYHLDGAAGGPGGLLLYGKVAADRRGALAGPVIEALRDRIGGGRDRFTVPRCYGFDPDLGLAVFEAIAGAPRVAQLLKARVRGEAPAAGDLTVEQAVEACARIAACLHTCGIGLGRPRPFEAEAELLRGGFALVRRAAPRLGEQFERWLAQAERHAAATGPFPRVLAHGDFSYTQLVFDGRRGGLVDFDTVCQAEAALDLGQFLAYLRMAVRKARGGAERLADELADRFLATYADRAGVADVRPLARRVRVYELLSLVRLAFHSWQKLKPGRLATVVAVLDERTAG